VLVHPVKSLAACAADEAVVEPWGLEDDRRWTLSDDGSKVVTGVMRAGDPFLG
jgi:uncharacterized protein